MCYNFPRSIHNYRSHKEDMTMLKKLAIAALLLWCLGLAGCSASGTGSGRQVKEIREYLESRYGSQDFQVEPSQNGGTAS